MFMCGPGDAPNVRKQIIKPKISCDTEPEGWKKTGRQTMASLRMHSISCGRREGTARATYALQTEGACFESDREGMH